MAQDNLVAPLYEELEGIYTELEEELYSELEGEEVLVRAEVHQEDMVDEGVDMSETDNRLAYWEWLEDYEDTMWEVEGDTDSVVVNLNLTEDEEEEETWE